MRRITQDERSRLLELAANGASLVEAAKAMQRSRKTLLSFASRENVVFHTRPRRPITVDERRQIIEMARGGTSLTQIAAAIKRPRDTVWRHAKRENVTFNARGPRVSDEERRRIIELARLGWKIRIIAEHVRRPLPTVQTVVWLAITAGDLPRRRANEATTLEMNHLRQLAAAGATTKDAAKALGRSRSSVLVWAKRENVRFRLPWHNLLVWRAGQ